MPHHENPHNAYVVELTEQFNNLLGQEITICLKSNQSATANFTGTLLKVTGNTIQMDITTSPTSTDPVHLTAIISDIAYFTNLASAEINEDENSDETQNNNKEKDKANDKGNKPENEKNSKGAEGKGHK